MRFQHLGGVARGLVPAGAGVCGGKEMTDSRLRGNDGFGRRRRARLDGFRIPVLGRVFTGMKGAIALVLGALDSGFCRNDGLGVAYSLRSQHLGGVARGLVPRRGGGVWQRRLRWIPVFTGMTEKGCQLCPRLSLYWVLTVQSESGLFLGRFLYLCETLTAGGFKRSVGSQALAVKTIIRFHSKRVPGILD